MARLRIALKIKAQIWHRPKVKTLSAQSLLSRRKREAVKAIS